MSYDRPDAQLMAELERLVRNVTEELTGWRRRCHRAESELQELKARSGPAVGPDLGTARARVAELERENAVLRERLEAVRERVSGLASRLAFLERGVEETA
jgi:predicted  nucleic acid-binding Zn-ribbon protein